MKKLSELTSNEDVKANFVLAGSLTRHYSGLLTHPNKGAVQNYTHGASYEVNNHLWREHKGLNKNIVAGDFLDVQHKLHKKQISKIDSVLHSHTTPHDLTVWSSSIHDPREKKNAEGIMHHPAYLSTSIYKPVAMGRDINSKADTSGEWHHHVYKIHVPKGSRGAYVDHISRVGGEYEFLLPRGSNLKYHDTDTTTKKNPWNDNIEHKHIHHMELIPNENS